MKLKRTIQCDKCPWKKATNPWEIPDGYSLEKHKALINTIAQKDPVEQLQDIEKPLNIMACHEEDEAHCIGFLHDQLGSGNNVLLRMQMSHYENADEIQIVGEQHSCFAETIPDRLEDHKN